MNTLFDDEIDSLLEIKDKNNEWYTPSVYIEAARKVMDCIDLDPASCKLANHVVKATRYYTQEESGLKQDWHGNVWCNPPFSITLDCLSPCPVWSNKMITEYQNGNMKQGILLIKAETKNPWFHRLFDYLMCISIHRVKFDRPGRKPQEIREGVVFVYFGPNEDKFALTFSKFGRIVRAIDTPKSSDATQSSLWDEEVSA